jgi:hypothetical protein
MRMELLRWSQCEVGSNLYREAGSAMSPAQRAMLITPLGGSLHQEMDNDDEGYEGEEMMKEKVWEEDLF